MSFKMFGVLSSLFNNNGLFWVMYRFDHNEKVALMLMSFFNSIISIEIEGSQNKSTALDVFKDIMNDTDKNILNRFDGNVTKSTSKQSSLANNEMVTKNPINEWVKQQSSNNDYQSMKRAFDTFNGKMDTHMAFYGNEMTFLTTKLNTLKDKFNKLETLHHEIDQIVSRQNVAEQKLNVIQDSVIGIQSINNKLDDLNVLMQQNHVRINDLMEKQRKLMPSSDETKRNLDIDDRLRTDDEQCEMKIDLLVAFVHSFAELNRIENTDILNRLENMQSQLIQFFDVKRTIQTNQLNEKSGNGTKENEHHIIESTLQNSSQLRDAQTVNATIQSNSTQIALNESMKMPSTSLNLANDTQNSVSNSNNSRKRKRTAHTRNRYKRKHKLRASQSSNKRFNNSHFRYERELSNDNTNSNYAEINVDVDSDIIKNDKQFSAKYGQPSPNGCHQFQNRIDADEIHRFATENDLNSERLCSYDKNGNAWTVIQQRNNISMPENFNRSWNDYKRGFGNLSGEFWYGNDAIHKLTYDDDMELKILLETWDERHLKLKYDIFRVDSEENRYNLFVSGFGGSNKTLDAFQYHHNQDFSTFDRQNDKSGINDDERCCSCAKSYSSGWWFNNCIEANLNGIYQVNPLNNNYVGIIWEKWLGDYSLKATKMMIRPKINWPNHTENEDYDDETSKKPPDDP